MISYQWGAQRFAKELYENLVQKGLNVWMDIQGGMSGGIFFCLFVKFVPKSKNPLRLFILTRRYLRIHG
jgi:hypothetical protein